MRESGKLEDMDIQSPYKGSTPGVPNKTKLICERARDGMAKLNTYKGSVQKHKQILYYNAYYIL